MNNILILLLFCGFVNFMKISNQYITMLISMELMMMSLFIMLNQILMNNFKMMDYLFLYFSMMILEGIFGLGLLIFLSQNWGKDKTMFNFS